MIYNNNNNVDLLWWSLCVASVFIPCCMLLYVVACCWDWLRNVWNRSKVKPGANGRNKSQHCWAKNVGGCCVRLQVALIIWDTYLCPIHSTKTMIAIGPTGKSDPPQKVDQFLRNFSGWIEPIHRALDRNFRKFWLNGSRPSIIAIVALTLRHGFHFQQKFLQWHKIN